MLFVSVWVLVLGQNLHDPMVDLEAVPLGWVSMLPDKLQADFSILSAGWVCFFLDFSFNHIYIMLPDSAVGFCSAGNTGWRRAGSVFADRVCMCGHILILRFR